MEKIDDLFKPYVCKPNAKTMKVPFLCRAKQLNRIGWKIGIIVIINGLIWSVVTLLSEEKIGFFWVVSEFMGYLMLVSFFVTPILFFLDYVRSKKAKYIMIVISFGLFVGFQLIITFTDVFEYIEGIPLVIFIVYVIVISFLAIGIYIVKIVRSKSVKLHLFK